MQSWKGKSFWLWLAVGATVVVVLAIVAFLVMDRFDDTTPDSAQAEKPVDRDKVTTSAKALELGDVAKISSNYKVAVSAITLHEGEQTQYLAATIKAEYIGTDTGEPWADLTVEFIGSDSRVSEESDCPIDIEDASEEPPLDTGEVATYVVCIDLPTRTIKGGKVSVEEAFAKGRKAYWSTAGAETKKIPSVPFSGSAAGGPSTQYRQPSRPNGKNSANDEWVEEYIDDVEEYKDWVEDMEDFADKYRKNPKADEDDIEEWDEWKEEYDEQIKEYEKWKKEYEASR